ncbi:hypothetical protein N431DRAFT_411948 [Stipitochalara longipes BDJ]|nr:hypothetical protein N431DRAFT_411948 [Stipitochalara longipes BDJ]
MYGFNISRLLFLNGLLHFLTVASPLLPRNSTQQYTFAQIPPSKDLVWYPCFTSYFCAVLDAPLDYNDRKEGRSYIPLIKSPAASTTPYKGMLLTNPGGPGQSGINLIFEISSLAAEIVPNYDIVSWDPRGIGYAIPVANCTLSSNLTVPAAKRRSLDKLYGPELPTQYFEHAYQVGYEAGQECGSSIGGPKDAGPHMATATVARDMIFILDAYAKTEEGKLCGEDASLLNYWGFSYGTFLGETFASRYPHRVGKIVLDGVIDPDDWISGFGLTEITLTDEVFSTFFLYCNLAGPSLCPYYTGTTARDIYLRFETLVNKLNTTYAIQQNWTNATAIEIVLQGIKELAFSWSYTPINNFPDIATLLVGIEDLIAAGLSLAAVEAAEAQLGVNISNPIEVSELWLFGVSCTDQGGKYYGLTLQDFADDTRTLEAASWLTGEQQISNKYFCAGWDIKTDYRYAGPFGGKTINPILFVSNTLDPVNPIYNGQKGTSIFKDAQLLTIEGIGHTSTATRNNCGYGKISAFFESGTLPGKDNYCPLEVGPWNVTATGPLAKRDEIREIREKIRGLGKF